MKRNLINKEATSMRNAFEIGRAPFLHGHDWQIGQVNNLNPIRKTYEVHNVCT